MIGKGADTYVVDGFGDVIIEDIAGTLGGINTVKSSIDSSGDPLDASTAAIWPSMILARPESLITR
jgi:hypothetical protein